MNKINKNPGLLVLAIFGMVGGFFVGAGFFFCSHWYWGTALWVVSVISGIKVHKG